MKRIFAFLLTVAVCASMSACGGEKKSTADKAFSFTVNCYSGNYVTATTQIIRKEGLLEKYLPEGVTVNYTELVSGPEIRDAMLSGDVQIADLSLMSFQTALENELPLQTISFCGGTPINLYSNKSDITALEDFSGTEQITVTNRATNLHAAYLASLKEAGLDIAVYDKMLVATPNTEALALLSDGATVSGSIFSFPTYMKTAEMENVHLVCDMSEAIIKYNIGSTYATTTQFYEEHPEIIGAFRKAQDDALDLVAEKPGYVAGLLAELYGVETSSVSEALEKMPPSRSLAGYDNLADLLYEVGILTKEPLKFKELPNYDSIADLGA